MFPQLSGGLLVTMVMIVATVNLGWYACVATVLTAGPARRIFERWQPVIDFTFGILLWAAALKLALAALA
jgi:threonine/homoserine/homoserine lactone efflux protein